MNHFLGVAATCAILLGVAAPAKADILTFAFSGQVHQLKGAEPLVQAFLPANASPSVSGTFTYNTVPYSASAPYGATGYFNNPGAISINIAGQTIQSLPGQPIGLLTQDDAFSSSFRVQAAVAGLPLVSQGNLSVNFSAGTPGLFPSDAPPGGASLAAISGSQNVFDLTLPNNSSVLGSIDTITLTSDVQDAPEPATLTLLVMAGLVGSGVAGRRRWRQRCASTRPDLVA